MHANNPLQRGVEPADVIGAIRYFVGARCVTGQVLVIDSASASSASAATSSSWGAHERAEARRASCPTTCRFAPRGSCSNRSRSRPTSAFTTSRSARRSGCWSSSRSGSRTHCRRPTTIPSAHGTTISSAAEVEEIAASRRFNLQETLAHAVFERLAAFRGVRALRVRTSKPDVYPDAHGVGVEIASFRGSGRTTEQSIAADAGFTPSGCGTKSVARPLSRR